MSKSLDLFGLLKILAFLGGLVGATIYVNNHIATLVDRRIDDRIELKVRPLKQQIKQLNCLIKLRAEARTKCLQNLIGGSNGIS